MKWSLAVLLFGLVLPPPAAAQDLKRGEKLLADACGSCHALGRGDSADKNAPAFRTLGRRYPIEISGRGAGRRLHDRPPGHAGIPV